VTQLQLCRVVALREEEHMSQTRCGSGVTARLRHWVGLLAYIFKILSKFKVVFIKVLPRGTGLFIPVRGTMSTISWYHTPKVSPPCTISWRHMVIPY
jgi:hypothetical protein